MNDTRDLSGYRIWFDAEYSSLDLDRACLLQVALLITDAAGCRVKPRTSDLCLTLRLSDGVEPSPWMKEHLPDLLAAARGSGALDAAEADRRLAAAVVDALGPIPASERRRPVLSGNSIHADWHLVRRWLPRFHACLHYRHLDVTTLKLLWLEQGGVEEFRKEDPEQIRRFFPEADLGGANTRHDAYYDVQASIAELNFYRAHLLRPPAARA